MADQSVAATEPTRLFALINAALVSTWGIVTLAAKVDPIVSGSIVTALGAWLAVAGEIVRSKVVPTVNVALTEAEKAALLAAGFRTIGPAGV